MKISKIDKSKKNRFYFSESEKESFLEKWSRIDCMKCVVDGLFHVIFFFNFSWKSLKIRPFFWTPKDMNRLARLGPDLNVLSFWAFSAFSKNLHFSFFEVLRHREGPLSPTNQHRNSLGVILLRNNMCCFVAENCWFC